MSTAQTGRTPAAPSIGPWAVALLGGLVVGVGCWAAHEYLPGEPQLLGLSAAALGAAFLAEAAIYTTHSPAMMNDALIAEAAIGLLLPFTLSRKWREAATTAGWLPILLAAGAIGWTLVYTLYPRLAG